MYRRHKHHTYQTNAPMAPAIVCYAFAAELFLKLLHKITVGNPEKIHGLEEIFSVLPQEMRLNLSQKYQRTANGDLEADINSVGSAFVDWRYLHEQTIISINPQVIMNISKVTYALCRELRPNIRVTGENVP